MLTPKDIETKEFSRSKVGGYKPEEVDDFLDQILVDYAAVIEERDALNKRVVYMNNKLDQLREEQERSKNIVVSTQRNQDEVLTSARKKADKLVYEAQDYAKKLIEAAKEEADRQQAVKTQLTAEVESFKAKLLSIYVNHVKLISTIPTIRKDSDEMYSSETLEMLKVATADVISSQSTASSYDSFAGETIVVPTVSDKKSYSDDLYSDFEEDEPVQEYKPQSRASRMQYDDYDDEDELTEEDLDTSKKETQIQGLFDDDKKKKSGGMFGKKKPIKLFNKHDDDDDDDDDDYDDEDDD